MPDPNPLAIKPILETEDLLHRGLEACVGASVVLEIGFGRAEFIIGLARSDPQQAYLGVEVSRKRVEKAVKRIVRQELANVRLVHAPAEYLLERVLPAACIAECWINCPDPWPKKRHHKRRLVQPAFAKQLYRVLRPGAVVHLSTDHAGYAEWIHDVLSRVQGFRNLHAPAPWSPQRPQRDETAYESEWQAEGRRLVYFEYRCNNGRTP